ncbi:hypothetical protein SAMN05444161_5891 [Rhizobiales bacterium GAS191]|nr:hypothetical protein SAMN05519104_5152 [Rhizobiales bacterium GAS188]SEE47727.1 hypothetical protein SAMN05444161_5891 [Rhizobiales bacterium GAS191]
MPAEVLGGLEVAAVISIACGATSRCFAALSNAEE